MKPARSRNRRAARLYADIVVDQRETSDRKVRGELKT
jgi:hypothetical protein